MIAQHDRATVTVNRRMPHIENGHRALSPSQSLCSHRRCSRQLPVTVLRFRKVARIDRHHLERVAGCRENIKQVAVSGLFSKTAHSFRDTSDYVVLSRL
jgi:hypothetical protein